MKNTFTKGAIYNAMQTMSPSALANNHTPVNYIGLVYDSSCKDENDICEHQFMYEGKAVHFDDDFTNNGKLFDNSMIIVEVNFK